MALLTDIVGVILYVAGEKIIPRAKGGEDKVREAHIIDPGYLTLTFNLLRRLTVLDLSCLTISI